YLYWSTKFALKKASKIIAVSNFTKQEIENFYPKAKSNKIKVIHNGYNSELYRLVDDEEKANEVLLKYGLEKPFFLYAGRLEKKKNTPTLIEAFAIMRENYPELKEKLVLIGNASFGYDEVKFVIEEYDLERDILMPGWVEEADMPYIFASASAFIFPTKYEGFGIPLLQAMACGLPIAVSNIPVLHEVAAEAALYFDPNNSSAIAVAMKSLASESALREDLRAKGLERVKNFDFEKCARETLGVLTEK
ncbi:glycosyltransferase family 4 protein, partial [Patescibacteria group bacterium]|nr:glycosyltransferase family 4 protein [Patescibacteria group bacterium]